PFAETGFVAKGTLTAGYPIAHDGVQKYPGKTSYYHKNLTWMELPWLQFYTTALSFLFLEPDGWSARFPFIVIGLAAAIPSYCVARTLFGTAAARIMLPMLLFSVPYLTHIRQCRYFALLALGSAVGVYAYLRIKENKPGGWALFSGAAIFLFHSHYAYFFGYMGGWVCWILLFDRPKQWKPLLLAAGCIFVFTFPFALYVNLFTRRNAYGSWSLWHTASSLGYYARMIHQHIVPWLLFPAFSIFFTRTFRRPVHFVGLALPVLLMVYLLIPARPQSFVRIQDVVGVLLFVGAAICVYTQWPGGGLRINGDIRQNGARFLMIWLTGALVSLSLILPNHAFRYLIGFLPFFYMLTACLLIRLWQRSKPISLLTGIVLTTTNVFSVLPVTLVSVLTVSAGLLMRPVTWLPPALTSALTDGYTPEEIRERANPVLKGIGTEIARQGTLRSPLYDYFYEISHPYGGPVETVVAYLNTHAKTGDTFSSDCDAVTLAFHTGLRFRSIEEKPEWISLRPFRFYMTHPSAEIRTLYDLTLMSSYDKIELNAPDFENIDYNLPDPDTHIFYPERFAGPRMILLRRKHGLE
ncbi:MAG: glycosyltransferase family 39 protein, partial [candidate division Zixibacteria bacterium]|nr:glycosyltransferase family 39 protein [candidate division Zixibacteria bacterium]